MFSAARSSAPLYKAQTQSSLRDGISLYSLANANNECAKTTLHDHKSLAHSSVKDDLVVPSINSARTRACNCSGDDFDARAGACSGARARADPGSSPGLCARGSTRAYDSACKCTGAQC